MQYSWHGEKPSCGHDEKRLSGLRDGASMLCAVMRAEAG